MNIHILPLSYTIECSRQFCIPCALRIYACKLVKLWLLQALSKIQLLLVKLWLLQVVGEVRTQREEAAQRLKLLEEKLQQMTAML